ncbi:hypothetical protein E2562_034492 [Oryza meyeriana var. granulata]|uniref:Uncharacterized protein n=1 Tax=Oryza meyeriana var. granulata TaxID=110450 RepID=A0A6G1CW66_9ORYZ|nr:hypothetical protein E2562_034492 [Oryza meyeriana var. granulata]KAF0904417.1 hypothetical protein E2562_034492 [Oryza meyeriana var. granulata]
MQPRLLPSAAVARPAPPAPLRPPPPCPTPCDAGSSPTPPARQQPPALPRRRLPCAGAAHPVLALLRRRRTPCIRPAPCARLLPASSPAPAPVLAAASADVHGFFPLYVEELPASLPPAQKDAVALPEELDDLLLTTNKDKMLRRRYSINLPEHLPEHHTITSAQQSEKTISKDKTLRPCTTIMTL